jgi:hypothetical protein
MKRNLGAHAGSLVAICSGVANELVLNPSRTGPCSMAKKRDSPANQQLLDRSTTAGSCQGGWLVCRWRGTSWQLINGCQCS